ncbi:hypothetical protein NDU88_005582 [Pleurodeles waltl]|uniref:Uncharacterized protein n=1 Tax=Pleurodeles waltl TaxID=8319 RepID=A0AAV7L4V2_PLEWA|nr:hypothetical protein NDU88_005582 [Pleurodeles waltl]
MCPAVHREGGGFLGSNSALTPSGVQSERALPSNERNDCYLPVGQREERRRRQGPPRPCVPTAEFQMVRLSDACTPPVARADGGPRPFRARGALRVRFRGSHKERPGVGADHTPITGQAPGPSQGALCRALPSRGEDGTCAERCARLQKSGRLFPGAPPSGGAYGDPPGGR